MAGVLNQLSPMVSFVFLVMSAASGLQWKRHQGLFRHAFTIISVAIPFLYFVKLTIFPEYFIVDVLLVLSCFVTDQQPTEWLSSSMNSIFSRFSVGSAGVGVYVPTIACSTFVNLILGILGTNRATANLASMVFETMVTTINVKVLYHIFVESRGWTDPPILAILCLAVVFIELGEWKLFGAPGAFPFFRTWGDALWSYVGVAGFALLAWALHKDSRDAIKSTRHTTHPLYPKTQDNMKSWLRQALLVLQDTSPKFDLSMSIPSQLLILLTFGRKASELGERVRLGSQSFGARIQHLQSIVGQDCFEAKLQEEVEMSMRANSVNVLCLINQNPNACNVVLVSFLVCIVVIFVVADMGSDVLQGLFFLKSVTLESFLAVFVVTVLTLKASQDLILEVSSKRLNIPFTATWETDMRQRLMRMNIGNCYTISVQNKHGQELSIEFQEGAVAPSAVVDENQFPLRLIAVPRRSCEAAMDAPLPEATLSESSDSWMPAVDFFAHQAEIPVPPAQTSVPSEESGSILQGYYEYAEYARTTAVGAVARTQLPTLIATTCQKKKEEIVSRLRENVEKRCETLSEKLSEKGSKFAENLDAKVAERANRLEGSIEGSMTGAVASIEQAAEGTMSRIETADSYLGSTLGLDEEGPAATSQTVVRRQGIPPLPNVTSPLLAIPLVSSAATDVDPAARRREV